ncbi:hypothetical protein K0M31_018458 [Melipona bicolor]|uniref:Carboxylesterase type B domain-containing protein n=1 Tax=Melipona bicolor TaxID=60889 RepID=A0AA40G3G9_9HYME|nr:hypothetical protein K0M31_018458 [Melipona bicolor]
MDPAGNSTNSRWATKVLRVYKKLLFFVASGLAFTQNLTDDQPIVRPPTGPILGSIFTSRLGRKIYSFRGIKYGEPPIGQLRFHLPIPANDWRNVFDATEEGPSCPYPDGKIMSEDCLRLNVYTTKLPHKHENVSRPVMIFIHPGGFYSFSGQSANFGPQYLLDKDIVLVTINYRLGILGFLNTGDSLVPGNMGLKDQVLAFQWVQRNIAAFGGNPNSVTLCGYGAGSFSIMLHMVSPMSANLFHRAIAMSSSAIKPEVYSGISQHGQLELVEKQARLLDCPTDSTSSMISCFRSKPAENFTDTLSSLFDWNGFPILLWLPAIEPEVLGIERFLTDQPYNLIKKGKFHQVPLILGVTEDERGGMITKEHHKVVTTPYIVNLIAIGTMSLQSYVDTNVIRYGQITLAENCGNSIFVIGKLIQLTTERSPKYILADSLNIFPVYRAAMLFATNSAQPVYFYKFTFQGRYSFYMLNDTTPYGVSHDDDLQYLFFMKNFFPFFESDTPEASMLEISTSMWSNFVIYGEPTPDETSNVTWTSLVPDLNETNFLDLNLHPSMKNDFFFERMNQWENLFPEPQIPNMTKP